jgi:hypothetical protein
MVSKRRSLVTLVVLCVCFTGLLPTFATAQGVPTQGDGPSGPPITQRHFSGLPLSGPQLVAPPLQPIANGSGMADSEEVDPSEVLPEPVSAAMLEFLESIIREHIPANHVDEKDWNKTKRVFAGVKLRREGLKLETKRRWKEVNDGLWRRYEVTLLDPEKKLDVRLSEVHWLPDGRLHARLKIASELLVVARQAQWNLDVRFYSFDTQARVRMELDVETTTAFRMDASKLPPTLVVDPIVEQASLRMTRFEVDKIGQIGGDIAEELGDTMEVFVRNHLVRPQSKKLADTLNRQIDKKRDKLRLDAGDWLNRWFKPS